MRVAIVVAMLLTTVSCKSPTAPDAAVGKPFTLKVGQSTTLPDGGWMRFNRLVSDSRCPIDAVCITAGDAVISLVFERGHLTNELHTDPSRSQMSYGNYVIKLTDLHPYPRASNPAKPEDYVATLVVL